MDPIKSNYESGPKKILKQYTTSKDKKIIKKREITSEFFNSLYSFVESCFYRLRLSRIKATPIAATKVRSSNPGTPPPSVTVIVNV